MKDKIFRFIIVLSLTIFSLTGCWDSNEPERMVYAHGIGVDFKDGKFIVYIQMINPSLLAKSESSGGEQEAKIVVARGEGKTLNKAIFNIYHSSQRRVFWGHVSFFIFTENALNSEALKATVDRFDRYRETRYNTFIYGTDEPLAKLLKIGPPFGMSTALSRLSDPKSTYEQSSMIKPIDLRELILSLNEPPRLAAIPFVKLTKPGTWETDEKPIQTVKAAGLYFIKDNEIKEKLVINDLQGFKWMNEKLKRDEIDLKNELADISLIIDEVKVKKIPIIEDEKVSFRFSIEAQATIAEILHKKKIERIEKEIERLMRTQVRHSFLKGINKNVDVYRLSETLYRKKVHVWKKIQEEGDIPLNEDSIKEILITIKLNQGEKQRKMPTLQ